MILPMLAQMGLAAEIEMIRPGYAPSGQGIIRLAVPPAARPLRPLAPRSAARAGLGDLAGIPP